MPNEKCRRCGSRRWIPIAYGLPGDEMLDLAERGRIELGGCVIDDDAPRNRCRTCGATDAATAGLDWDALSGPTEGEFAEHRVPLTLDLLDEGATDAALLALSFDAYAAVGSGEAQRLARRTRSAFEAGRRLPSELVTLRCALFMEQRGAHHRGEPMDGPYVTALVAAMRRAVAGGGRQVMDGDVALRSLAHAAGYPSLCHLLASQTIFLHPKTVRQAEGRATFPVVRGQPRGERARVDDEDVILDDNTTPTLAFLWAADRRPGRDVQYNHVWPNQGRKPATYTALWNVCVTPASLAKLTDGATHPDTVGVLQYRAVDLYGCLPDGVEPPDRPERYDELESLWHPMPEPVDLEVALRAGLAAKPSSRAAQAARQIGWLFSDGPDEHV